MKRLFRGNLTPRRVLVALVLVTTALGGTIVYAQAARTTTTYRTAQVAYGTITQSLGMAGNLQPISQANLNFASSGTAQPVSVATPFVGTDTGADGGIDDRRGIASSAIANSTAFA